MNNKLSKRKIAFFTLDYNQPFVPDRKLPELVEVLIEDICKENKINRKRDITNEKFCFLSMGKKEKNGIFICDFVSAEHGTRFPLIDKDKLSSRDNPKNTNEGEEKHTHLLLKTKGDEVYALLEQGRDVISMKMICEYLNFLYRKLYKIKESPLSFSIIASDSFEKALKSEITYFSLGEIFIDKQLLGSASLNFSDRISTVRETMILQIKPDKKKNIRECLLDIFQRFCIDRTEVKRIRIKGKSSKGVDCFADTEIAVKKKEIKIQKDEKTGAVNSSYIFTQMKEIADQL